MPLIWNQALQRAQSNREEGVPCAQGRMESWNQSHDSNCDKVAVSMPRQQAPGQNICPPPRLTEVLLQEGKSSLVGEVEAFVGINGASGLEDPVHERPRKEGEVCLALVHGSPGGEEGDGIQVSHPPSTTRHSTGQGTLNVPEERRSCKPPPKRKVKGQVASSYFKTGSNLDKSERLNGQGLRGPS